jgi:hypothetical protein
MLYLPPEGTAPLSELTVHDRNGSRLVQLPFWCVQGFPTVVKPKSHYLQVPITHGHVFNPTFFIN